MMINSSSNQKKHVLVSLSSNDGVNNANNCLPEPTSKRPKVISGQTGNNSLSPATDTMTTSTTVKTTTTTTIYDRYGTATESAVPVGKIFGSLPGEVAWRIRTFLLGNYRQLSKSKVDNFYTMMNEYCGYQDLQEIARQFADADTFNIVPEISASLVQMVDKAWNFGWSSEEIHTLMKEDENETWRSLSQTRNDSAERKDEEDTTGINASKSITFMDAVQIIHPLLSSICNDCLNTVRANMKKNGTNWNNDLFKRDVTRVICNLKRLYFKSFNMKDFDNLQAAINPDYKATHILSRDAQNAIFVIQNLCLRFVSCFTSLRFKTNSKIVNDTAGTATHSTMNQVHAVPQYDESVTLMPHWPECCDVDDINHWAKHFSAIPEGWCYEYEEEWVNGPWLTPQMAKNLNYHAFYMAQLHLDSFDDCSYAGKLPRIATPFYKKSTVWRKAYVECHMRIAARLANGLEPSPNCTGEEMALHNIIDCLENGEEYKLHDSIVKFKHDQNFDLLRENSVEDMDVFWLFEDGDNGFSCCFFIDSDEELDKYTPGPFLQSALWGEAGRFARVANLHPADWFVPFRMKNYRNHL